MGLTSKQSSVKTIEPKTEGSGMGSGLKKLFMSKIKKNSSKKKDSKKSKKSYKSSSISNADIKNEIKKKTSSIN